MMVNTVIGSGGLPTPDASTNTALTGSMSVTNPDLPFMGGVSAWAAYIGQPGPDCGTLQGGASEAWVDMGSATDDYTVSSLGFEAIANTVGNTTHTIPGATGLQGTAFVADTVTCTNLTAILGRAPFSNGGTPTVENAYTFRAQEPLVGTNRYTWYGEGRHRFVKGDAANTVEIAGTANVLRWAVPGAGGQLVGYASDGASERLRLDTDDTPESARFVSNLFGSGKHASFSNLGREVFAVAADGALSIGGATTRTAPAAGDARTLPRTPAGYVAITIGGTPRKVAYY